MDEIVPPQINQNKSELTNLSVRDLFYKYIRYAPLFVVSVSISLLAAYVYLRYTPSVYSSTGSLLIRDEKSKGTRAGDKVEELFTSNAASNIQAEMEILKSRPLMKRVVENLNLSIDYYGVGKIKTVNVYKKAPFLIMPIAIKDSGRSFAVDVLQRTADSFQVGGLKKLVGFGEIFDLPEGSFRLGKNLHSAPGNLFRFSWRPPSVVAAEYAGAIKVVPKTVGPGILNIGLESSNPYLSADIVNALISEYSRYSVEQKKQSNDQILSFVDSRIGDIGARLDSVQNQYLDYQVRNNIINPEEQLALYFENVVESDKQGTEQSLKLSVSGMLDDYLSDKKNEYIKIVVPSTLGIEDPTLNSLVAAYNQAQLERKALVDGNVPLGNAAVKLVEGQLEKLRLSIRENLNNIRSATQSMIVEVRQRGAKNQLQLNAMPQRIKELAEIKRQLETYQALYKLFIEKREETAIARASTVSSSSIIDQAGANETPISPNRRSVQLIAFLIGMGIPALFIFATEIFNDKIQSRFDIEKYTQTPILGEVGHSFTENSLVINRTSRSMVAEQFRIIRTNLQYYLNKKSKATILVTSTFSGEGKSFASTNIAAAHALTGKKTILLEFDIRKPKLLSGLGMPKGPGITNFLVGNITDLGEAIRPVTEIENLYILGCGPVPPNPAEILLDSRVKDLFDYVQSHFDVVVIDTAPVGMVSDGITLGKFADCTIYMMRQNYSFKRQLALVEDYYQQKRLPQLSVVLNDVKSQGSYGYYGYGQYGYGYGSGYGYSSYFEEEQKGSKGRLDSVKGWWKGLWG
jgi:capsular exopolysaccharide synthesis family protein